VLKGAAEGFSGRIAWQPVAPLLEGTVSACPAAAMSGNRTADAQAVAAEAHQKGFREGELAGRRSVEAVVERLAHSIEQISGLAGRVRKDAEADLLRLSIAIARRILYRELSVDPEAISGLIRVALEKLRGQEINRVRVHPEMEGAVRASLEHLGAARSVQVVSDRGRQPGDAIFETDRGNLDASVETQLQEIGRGLADRLRNRT
jgi:flagellar assembly protein FliH